MINLEEIKQKIVEALKPLDPDKIILFGSYAYGNPNEESDLDIYILKNGLNKDNVRDFELKASKKLRTIKRRYKTNGIDVLAAPTDEIEKKEDYFYKVELLQQGKVWYAKQK